MRIIGGSLRGLTLAEVGTGDAAAHLRPTSDRVREAIFNLLTNGAAGNLVTGAVVLDLFAGTGALGIEGLSRGATHATFVDDGEVAHRLLKDNIRRAKLEGQTTTLRSKSAQIRENGGASASLVFLDPPYDARLGVPALAAARKMGWLAPGATVVWEESRQQPAPDGFRLTDARRYGDTWVTVLEAS